MSAPDPAFDVLFVPRGWLPLLPTVDDPATILWTQVPTPFRDPDGQPFAGQAVAVTVVSMLDEPVEAVGVYTSMGSLVGRPQVRVDGQVAPPPSLAKELSGQTGQGGWIDPAGFDDLVSVGNWLVRDYFHGSSGPYVGANLVLHLRATGSGVDILIGALSAVRIWPGGRWNPYCVSLHEPGDLEDHPDSSVYEDFYNTYVADENTAVDTEGTSAAGTVSFLARSPQGRTSELWHIMVMLGPRPIKTMWDEPSTYQAGRRAAAVEDGVNRLLAATVDPNPDGAAQLRLQDATNGIPIDLLDDVATEYQKRLKDLAKASGD